MDRGRPRGDGGGRSRDRRRSESRSSGSARSPSRSASRRARSATTRSSACSAAAAEREKGAHRLYGEADVARLQELIRLRDLLGLSLEELVELAEAEEARAALRDQWAQRSDRRRARRRSSRAAIPLVERQLELVQARQQTLADFADELGDKLRTLARTAARASLARRIRGKPRRRHRTLRVSPYARRLPGVQRWVGQSKKGAVMFKTIVWATDGSESADRALPFAKELATGEGRTLVIVHGKEIFVGGRGQRLSGSRRRGRARGEDPRPGGRSDGGRHPRDAAGHQRRRRARRAHDRRRGARARSRRDRRRHPGALRGGRACCSAASRSACFTCRMSRSSRFRRQTPDRRMDGIAGVPDAGDRSLDGPRTEQRHELFALAFEQRAVGPDRRRRHEVRNRGGGERTLFGRPAGEPGREQRDGELEMSSSVL